MDPEEISRVFEEHFGAGGVPEEFEEAGRAGQFCSGDQCPRCRVALVLSDLSLVCPDCGADFDAADLDEVLLSSRSDARTSSSLVPRSGRLQIVGVNGRRYQGKLDSVNPASSAEQQKIILHRELLALNEAFEGKGKNPFPRNALARVVDVYNQIQRIEVKRSDEKRAILAAILRHVCLELSFSRSPADCAAFANLPRAGLAKGEAYLRRRIEEGLVQGFALVVDQREQILTSAFAQLELDPAAHEETWAAVIAIVEVAKRRFIAKQSEPKSKILGALASVLIRRGDEGALVNIAKACKIRQYTLTNVLTELQKFHRRFFEAIYKRHGIPWRKAEGWSAKKGRAKK